ncbi:hypothetical protein C8J36_10227 [Rhizobium sp. PP-F2F-G48]|uniref:hypothetical protein n=1 Tax=Rhizobium sp. PP-F2F-G48 TaxID=2135651 RepID=UPI0010DAE98C|nr:hypothetical protein C8J36_10227 [Rhizobium sp. PP-F2F-G48]
MDEVDAVAGPAGKALENAHPKTGDAGTGSAEARSPHPRRHGPQISIGSWHMPLPRQKWLRVLIGCLLVVFGLLGFLPILGFWMVPLGLVVLSHDSSYIRRRRRRMAVWWERRKRAKAAAKLKSD